MASEYSEDVNETNEDLAAIKIFNNYPEELLKFAYVLCVIFILIGIPTNLITIIALAVCRKFRNATAIFIINLHISNLLFCCVVLPVTAVTFSSKQWIFGKTMCNVYPLMKYALNCTAHFSVVAITINRYIIICHPKLYPRFYKRKIIIISLISTWVFGFSLFLPTFFGVWGRFHLDPRGGDCTMQPDKNNISPKPFFLVLAFAGPYIIFIICYSQIWWTVRKAGKKRTAHNINAIQPAMSNSASDPSIVENGVVCQEPTPYESSTDDDANNVNSPIVSTPDAKDNKFKQFFRNTFKVIKSKDQLHLPTRKDKKLATMIFALMLSFVLCHFPIMLSRVLYGKYKFNDTANVLVLLMEYSSVYLSTVIYVIMSSEYRQVYTSLFDDIKIVIMRLFKS